MDSSERCPRTMSVAGKSHTGQMDKEMEQKDSLMGFTVGRRVSAFLWIYCQDEGKRTMLVNDKQQLGEN